MTIHRGGGRGDDDRAAMATEVFLRVEMGQGFAVDGELLGTRWEVSGAPAPLALAFPRQRPELMDARGGVSGQALLAPDLGAATDALATRWRTHQAPDERDAVADVFRWGGVSSWDPVRGLVLEAIVTEAVAVATYEGDADRSARRLRAAGAVLRAHRTMLRLGAHVEATLLATTS